MMSRKRTTTHQRILEAARSLLLEHGFAGVSMESVATAAGVSRQAVYLHFASKSELLVALAAYADEHAGTEELLAPVREAKTPIEALEAGIAAYAAIEPRIYGPASAIYEARRSDEAAEAAWQDRMAIRHGNIRRGIEWVEHEGLLAPALTVAEATDLVWALLSLHTYENLVIERGWPMERFVGHMQRIVKQAVLRPEEV